jgi:hypothetical protein
MIKTCSCSKKSICLPGYGNSHSHTVQWLSPQGQDELVKR